MLVIFNAHFIFLLIIALPIAWFLSYLNPGFLDLRNPLFWLIITTLSFLTLIIKIKPRIYTIPIWMIGSFAMCGILFYKNGVSWLILGIIYVLLVFGLTIVLRLKLIQYEWRKAQELLNDFLNTGKIESPEELVYFPVDIYTNSLFAERYYSSFYDYLQKKWFTREDVKIHYQKILDKIKSMDAQLGLDDQHLHLRSLFEKVPENGVSKFLITNIHKRLSEDAKAS